MHYGKGFSMKGFRREMWNMEWILGDSGSCNQKRAVLSYSVISNAPKYLWSSFTDEWTDSRFWIDSQTLSPALRLDVG